MENQTWTTWDELLLACAVKRHGFNDWDSVSMEIQSRTSLPIIITTAHHCELKYYDLKQRFTKPQQLEIETNDGGEDIPWLEDLRSLRVAELRQEVQRYDVSILSLQSKVKRLEEENDGEEGQENGLLVEKPDLEEGRSENDKRGDNKGVDGPVVPEKIENRKLILREDSDRENRSVNGSNSTGSNQKTDDKDIVVKSEPEPIQTEPVPVLSGSNSRSVEEDDSVTQISSDVQSSASLGRKRRRVREVSGDSVKPATGELEPLNRVLYLIRSSKGGSLFESRLESQETEEYKNLVRQHMDLGTVQSKLEEGAYNFSSLPFYRDLLLLFNNAVTFFPKSSRESLIACKLLTLVTTQMSNETQKPDSVQETLNIPPEVKPQLDKSNSLLASHKSAVPIVVCRKRSSISTKPSVSSTVSPKVEQQQKSSIDDKEKDKRIVAEQQKMNVPSIKTEEKPITGTRSTRKGNSNSKLVKDANVSSTNKKQTVIVPETSKSDTKKDVGSAASGKKKGAADFLKRIKKNSPQEESKKKGGTSNNGGSGGGGAEQKKGNNSGKKDIKGQDSKISKPNGDRKQQKDKEGVSPSKRSVGRPPKKMAETTTVPGRRKRENDSNDTTTELKAPAKRSRR